MMNAADLARLGRLITAAVIAASLLVLVGWFSNVPALRALGGSVEMNPATAVCFAACGVAVLASAADDPRRRKLAVALAGSILLIGVVRGLGYAWGIEVAIDRMLANGSANRMALNTAMAFVFFALAILVSNVETRRGFRPAEPAAAISALIALLALTGHAYDVPLLSRVASHVIPMAEITSLTFMALTVGLLTQKPKRGWMAVMTGTHAGGSLARRLLPLSIALPVLLGFIALQGQLSGIYSSAAGYAGFAVASVMVLSAVVLWTARSLGRADQALREAHEAQRRLNERLLAVGDASLAISDTFASDDTLQQIADRARGIASAELAAVGIGTDPKQPFSAFAHSGLSSQALAALGKRPHPVGLRGHVLHEDKAVRIANLRAHAGSRGLPPEIDSFLAVPIRHRGQSVGSIYLGNKRGGAEFTEQDEYTVSLLASHVAIALDNARLYRESRLERTRLETVLEQLPEGIVVRDEAGDLVICNRQARTLAKRTTGWLDVFHTNGQRMARCEHPVWRALERGEVVAGLEAELNVEGARIPVLVNAAPIHRPDGVRVGAVGVFQDITPFKQMERMREEWNAVIAHDLRQPVNLIQLSASVLESRLTDAPDSAIVARILRSARSLEVMIGDLLDLSRIEAKRLDLRLESVDIVRLVEQQVERVLATDPGHAIRVTTAGVCPWLSLDPLRIEQVIGNLLSNASKYSDANSEILVTIEARASEVEVAVTNRGPGIPAEELSQLFTRFYRTRSARSGRVRGIGLGLYLCKSLVEAHGGVIDANSLTGETTFRFTLPSAESVSPSA